ncbi:MAG: GDSL-type esterase/lipase family protein [Candidatus Adiutrix sp.]|jgi:lysophospholipase L1-like esterase|nr:GDSL-type esterase/lipase family protein [Candidatus Adiutrix sp.]
MKVVCLGDSLTFGYELAHEDKWVTLAAEASGHQLLNRGVNGDTTGGMLARLQRDVLDHNPQLLLVTGGGNDLMAGDDSAGARANLSAIVQQARSRGLRALIATLPPLALERLRPDWAGLTDFPRLELRLSEYVQWQRLFARTFGFTLVDFRSLFDKGDGAPPDPALYLDGLHLGPEGNRLMAGEVVRVLKMIEQENGARPQGTSARQTAST